MGVNVNFKRGTHAALMNLASYVDGTFYLTTDTNRLYFSQNGNLVDLNQYIHMATGINPSSPPSSSTTGYTNLQQGDIYYWSDRNILAICDDPSTGEWTQLNPDTSLVANANNITLTNGTNQINLSLLVQDSKVTQSTGAFSIAGGTNVTVSQTNGVITISSTDTNDNATYTLGTTASASNGIVKLAGAGTGGTDSSVTLTGDGSVSVTSDAAGNITISGTGGLSAMSTTYNAAGGFQINYTTTDGSTATTAITPTITYGENNATSAVFASGTAALDVYTKAEVDAAISDAEAAANAMTYKGTVSDDDKATKIVSTANVGDTYKAEEDFTLSGIGNVKTGDLLIAKGSDGSVTWDLVPSGDDQTITGSVSGNNASISDQDGLLAGLTVNGSSSSYGTIGVASSISGKLNTLTISHGAAGSGTAFTVPAATTATTQSQENNNTTLTIPVITGISKDAAGHVTAVSGATYVLEDTHANVSSVAINVSNSTTANANIQIAVADSDTPQLPKTANFNLASDNLEITSTSSNNVYTVNLNYVWGTF